MAMVCICIYIFTSQFVTKARATTQWSSFAIDEDCALLVEVFDAPVCPYTSAKLDTFESKKSCRAKTHGQVVLDIPNLDLSTAVYIKSGNTYCPYIYQYDIWSTAYIYTSTDPPDNTYTRVQNFQRMWIIEQRE